jgi:hypothetical protein
MSSLSLIGTCNQTTLRRNDADKKDHGKNNELILAVK